nr:glutamate receptor 2.8-like [Ipomoea batatas]
MKTGLELLKAVKVDAIIGAQKSAQANFVMDLGDIAKVPVISFSATSTSLCHSGRAMEMVKKATASTKQTEKCFGISIRKKLDAEGMEIFQEMNAIMKTSWHMISML